MTKKIFTNSQGDELHVDSYNPTKKRPRFDPEDQRGKYAERRRKIQVLQEKVLSEIQGEDVFSMIKRVMRENVRSVRVKAQNNEIRFRPIALQCEQNQEPRILFNPRISTKPVLEYVGCDIETKEKQIIIVTNSMLTQLTYILCQL
jgi:hypothetical protein